MLVRVTNDIVHDPRSYHLSCKKLLLFTRGLLHAEKFSLEGYIDLNAISEDGKKLQQLFKKDISIIELNTHNQQ